MSKLRFQISMSLDGFVAGPSQSVENLLGVGGEGLHEWAFPTKGWRSIQGLPGSGERLFDRIGDDLHGLQLVRTIATPQVTHLKFARQELTS